MPATKRNKLEIALDMDRQVRFRLQGVPVQRALVMVNDLREEDAYQRALRRGVPEPLAKDAARRARVSERTLMIDYARFWKAIRKDRAAQGAVLIEKRIVALHQEEAKLSMAEAICWEELEASGVQEIDVTPRPEGEEKKRRGRDLRPIDRIITIVEARVRLTREIFQLQATLGLQAPEELAFLAGQVPGAAPGEKMLAHEVGFLYNLDARSSGLAASDAASRVKTVTAYLEAKEDAQGGGAGTPKGDRGRVVIEVRGLPAAGAGDSERASSRSRNATTLHSHRD